MNEKVKNKIENVYEVFANYRRPERIEGCPCCLTDSESKTLHEKKLRELTAEDLKEYTASVFLTVGGLADFKYYLPRILELSLEEELIYPYLGVVFERLKQADWQQWPEEERKVVEALAWEFFAGLIDVPAPKGGDIDEWVRAIGWAVADVNPLLDELLKPGREKALAEFVEWNIEVYTAKKPGQGSQLVDWLFQPEVSKIVKDKYGMVF